MVVLTRYEKPKPGLWPGCMQVGDITLEDGSTIPLYEDTPPQDKPSINTLEGWSALAERQRKSRENRLHA